MKDYDLFNQIEENVPEIKESKERAWGKIVEETGYPAKNKKRAKIAFNRWIAVASVALVICFMIPLAMYLFREKEVENRFCSQQDYLLQISQMSLTDLAMENDKLLYFPWQESEMTTYHYIDVNDSTVKLGINAAVYNPTLDVEVVISIIFPNILFVDLEDKKDFLINSNVINDTEVLWINNSSSAYAYFQKDEYTYYLDILMPVTDGVLMEIVEDLLSSK